MTPDDPNDPMGLAKEIERLANAYFAGAPGPAMNIVVPHAAVSPGIAARPDFGPNAMNMGAGGASPATTMPPIPGPMHRMPIAAAPLPKESDLRGIPTLLSESFGTPSVIALASAAPANTSTPYFLDLAGLPSSGGGGPLPGPPSGIDDRRIADVRGRDPGAHGMPDGELRGPDRPWTDAGGHDMPGADPRRPDSHRRGTRSPDAYGPGLSRREPRGVNGSGTDARRDRPPPAAGDFPRANAFDVRPEIVSVPRRSRGLFDAHAIARDFPVLRETVHGRRLVWLDNAATTQKPQVVIDRLAHFYAHENSNVHRAAHALAARATDAFEAAREKVSRFINSPSSKQIVWVRGTTEAINLVSQGWGRRHVGKGDEIVITWLEHHANIVPWQMLAADRGARLRVAPVNERGEVILDEYERLLGPRTRIVSFTHVSNALGTITPAREMVAMAHRHGARVLVDGAQAVSHMPSDVQDLDCDFYCFSGHKVFGPTGIGALFGKEDALDEMPPWQGGGNMISDVTFEGTSYQPPPQRFEAGTGNIADAAGLGAALDYLADIGLENVSRYEHELLVYATDELCRVPGLRLLGRSPEKAAVLSFVMDGLRNEDVGSALDQEGIAVRSGHHCAQPILRRYGLESSVRASLAMYNTDEDVDALVSALHRLRGNRPVHGRSDERTHGAERSHLRRGFRSSARDD